MKDLKGIITEQFVVRSPHDAITIPEKTFAELIWDRFERWKNHKAVVCGLTSKEYTYSELKEDATYIGKSLIDEGLNSEDVLAILLLNSPQYISIILGAAERGLTICSINPLYTADEISYQIKNSGAKMIITFPEKIQVVMKAVENLKRENCLPVNFKILHTEILQNYNITIPKDTISLDDLVNRLKVAKTTKDTNVKISGNSLAMIAHSSGTSGLPKGVCHTHKNITAGILQMSHPLIGYFQDTNDDYQDIIPIIIPIFHNFGLSVTLCALYHGSKVVTLPRFEERAFLSIVKNHRVTKLFLVPPMVLFLGSNPLVAKEHFQSVRIIFTGAAPIGLHDIRQCLQKLPEGIKFMNGYGLTEATCALALTPCGFKNYESVGIPVVNTKLKVVDQQTGEPKKPNEEGEICFKGPQMSLGYLNNPKANEEVIDDEGWFHSGDIGYYDEDGFFYITDRIKELIKVKGFQVAPAELEHVLRSCPGIEQVGVIGIPDHRKGEVPIGFIKKEEGSTINENTIHEFLASKVASFKLIKKYIFVGSIPTSASGKILRKELKKQYLAKL